MPPQADVAHSPDHASMSLGETDTLIVGDTEDHALQYKKTHHPPIKPVVLEVPPLGLPVLITGICLFTSFSSWTEILGEG